MGLTSSRVGVLRDVAMALEGFPPLSNTIYGSCPLANEHGGTCAQARPGGGTGDVAGTRRETLLEVQLWTPALLNLPSAFLGLARNALVPKGMLLELWRSISWPFVGIIFWWLAGRGIEALAASQQRILSPLITWIEVFIAFVIASSAALCLGFLLDPSTREEFIYPWRSAVVAAGLWILLGAATIAARLMQWRIRRPLKTEPASHPA